MTVDVRGTADGELPDGDPSSIVRRAPFADRPNVGRRGQQAQQRILEAALTVFGEVGYHGCGVKRITELSGCSRASFYQYFSSKEDLFRHLSGRVARELSASANALEPITGDADGWTSLHDWLDRYATIYDANEPVFVTFQSAAESDRAVAVGAVRVAARSYADVRAKIEGTPLTAAQVDRVVRVLFDTVARANRESELLEQASTRAVRRPRLNVAFADAVHRTLFGRLDGVNVHDGPKRLIPVSEASSLDVTAEADKPGESHGPVAQRTRTLLLDTGRRVFVERGYYATRVADIVEEAGVSHGVFYRYFENKTQLFRILAEQASVHVLAARGEVPDLADGRPERSAALRAWLRLYARSYASEAAIFTMWHEAMSRDNDLAPLSAAVMEHFRAKLARALEPRGWGDHDADALVLLALLDGMTARHVTPSRIEAVAQVIECGLLGAPLPAA